MTSSRLLHLHLSDLASIFVLVSRQICCGYMCDICNNYVDGGDICECYKERIRIARSEEREEQRRFENTLSKNIDRYVRFVPTRKRVRRLATYTGGKKK